MNEQSQWNDPPLAIQLGSYTPIAAKEYHCQMCGTQISIGQKYKKQVYKCEGKIETYRM